MVKTSYCISVLVSAFRFAHDNGGDLLTFISQLPDSIIHELEVGQSYLIPLDEGSNNNITVTVIDANHVPGAVMFLFQGEKALVKLFMAYFL